MKSAEMIFAHYHSLCRLARAGWYILPTRKLQMSNWFQSLYLENCLSSVEKCLEIATSHPTTRYAGGKDKVLEGSQMSSTNSLFLPSQVLFFFKGKSCQTSSALSTLQWGLGGIDSGTSDFSNFLFPGGT